MKKILLIIFCIICFGSYSQTVCLDSLLKVRCADKDSVLQFLGKGFFSYDSIAAINHKLEEKGIIVIDARDGIIFQNTLGTTRIQMFPSQSGRWYNNLSLVTYDKSQYQQIVNQIISKGAVKLYYQPDEGSGWSAAIFSCGDLIFELKVDGIIYKTEPLYSIQIYSKFEHPDLSMDIDLVPFF